MVLFRAAEERAGSGLRPCAKPRAVVGAWHRRTLL